MAELDADDDHELLELRVKKLMEQRFGVRGLTRSYIARTATPHTDECVRAGPTLARLCYLRASLPLCVRRQAGT